MRSTATRATALFLAAAAGASAGTATGAAPSASPSADAPASDRTARLQQALATARRTLAIQEFMLQKLGTLGDTGISPSYQEEVEGYRTRIFETRALCMALERALRELCGVEPLRTPRPTTSALPGAPEGPPEPPP